MTFEKPPQAICPHCGSEFDYEELCRVCGKLADGDIPVQKVSLTHIFGSFLSRLQGKRSNGVDLDDLCKEEPEFDSSWSLLSSNVYHSRFQMFHGVDQDNDND
jgi:hypothetical protein